MVAAHAASALAALDLDRGAPIQGSTRKEELHLKEALPIWLMSGSDLERARADQVRGALKLGDYMKRTPLWLHMIYRDGTALGYMHGRRGSKGGHEITNVSVTGEAKYIQQAMAEADHALEGQPATAGIFECPQVSVAGVIAFPRRRKDAPLIALFRDPSASLVGAKAPIDGRELIERLLRLRVIRGPIPTKSKRPRRPSRRRKTKRG
jgi:hypothetical protein